MPGMDGYEVLQNLKADDQTSNIPVILISSRTAPEDLNKGRELGSAGHIAKPFIPETVMEKIRKLTED